MIRVAIVLVRHVDGRWFVHRRRSDKRVFPGLYGIGAGGRIEPGEDPDRGAVRELFEETGLSVPVVPIDAFVFDSSGVIYEVHGYSAVTEGAIDNCDDEWADSRFVSDAELDALRDAGQLCPDTAELLRRYRVVRWER